MIIADRCLDNGLSVLSNQSADFILCASEPVGGPTGEIGRSPIVFGQPTSAPNGRQVTSQPISAGTISAPGTARWWIVTARDGQTLCYDALVPPLTCVEAVFTLGPLTIVAPTAIVVETPVIGVSVGLAVGLRTP